MDDDRFVLDMNTTRLTVRKTRLADDGNYACSVKTTGFPPTVSNSAHLYVYSVYSQVTFSRQAIYRFSASGGFVKQEQWERWRAKRKLLVVWVQACTGCVWEGVAPPPLREFGVIISGKMLRCKILQRSAFLAGNWFAVLPIMRS